MPTELRTPPGPVGDGFDEEVLLRAEEVASRLQVPTKRVYELPIARVRISRRTIRWRPSDVEEFLARRREAV